MFSPQYCSLMPHVSLKLFCPQYWCPIVRHWAHSTNWFLWYWLMTIYIIEDLINCFHQTWDTLPKIKFVKGTTITVSLSFMSTQLPGDDFELDKNTIFMKHPPDCQLSSDWLNNMTQRKFLGYPLVNIVIWPWSESRCPLRCQVYSVTTMNIISGNHDLGVTLCFDHINEKWMIIWVSRLVGLLFRLQFVHPVTIHSVTIHKVTEWTSWYHIEHFGYRLCRWEWFF